MTRREILEFTLCVAVPCAICIGLMALVYWIGFQ
jgi:hypothetical protein